MNVPPPWPRKLVVVPWAAALWCSLSFAAVDRAAAATATVGGTPRPAITAEQRARHLRELKAIERDILMAGASARRARNERTARLWRQWRGLPPLLRPTASRPAKDFTEAGGPQGMVRGLGPERSERRVATPFNQIVNDRSQDVVPGITQSEMALGVLGNQMLMAWNDGEGLRAGTSGMGYATSIDGGATWIDGGAPPLGDDVVLWYSDPLVAVDEKLGDFYFAGLALSATIENAIAVVRGRFSGTQFLWDAPVVARSSRDTLTDKPWLVADSLSGNLYLAYTTFFGLGPKATDQIEIQRSLDRNQSWSPPLKLSIDADDGLVQGPRPVLGPGGELRVAWRAADTTLAAGGLSAMRMRSSYDGGVTFEPQVDVTRFYSNFGSGAPGFNRGFGIDLPGLAVDRTGGPRRGRTYAIWNEAVNVFGDVPPDVTGPVDVEPAETAAAAIPFTIGETLRGDLSSPQDQDWFAFAGAAGRTVVFYADSLADDLDAALRLVCSDRSTRLALSSPLRTRRRFIFYTLPTEGTFYVRIAATLGTTGGYRLRTTWHEPAVGRARDHRDVFAAWSDDGSTWSEPVRVNDEPGLYDDCLPEIAVAGDGSVYALWYDYHDSPAATCGGESWVYMARSIDGGATWASLGPVSDVGTNWSDVFSNLSPNQGDYINLIANDLGVYPCWADGRNGDPDVYMAFVPLASTPALVSFAAADAQPDRVTLRWSAPNLAGAVVRIERRTEAEDWGSVGQVMVSGDGVIAFIDATVTAGRRYGYRVAFTLESTTVTGGEVWTETPLAVPLALAIERLAPNPTTGPLEVSLTLPAAAPAWLELLDVRGRRVARRDLAAQGGRQQVRLDEGTRLAAGLYWVRIRQGGTSVVTRVAIVR
jgi:hypothetical protein